MSKEKVTKKYLKEHFIIINTGNGNIQNLLRYRKADYYCTRVEGWACDAYIFGRYAILDGYDCIGKVKPYEVMKEYDNKAEEIFNQYWRDNKISYEEFMELTYDLIMEFIEEVA